MEKFRKKHHEHGDGNFQLRINEINTLEIKEFQNPWSFHSLFISGDDIVYNWLRKNGLLASDLTCQCGKEAKLNRRNRLKDGYTFRCGSQHEFTMHKNSFFEKSSYNIRDLIIFIKYYIEGHSLHQCALNTGMDYRHTAVNWASYIRELFCQYVFDTYERITFDGEVEIDESIFGRKVKYHKGQPRGLRIWIFGLIERQTNRIILYPVDSRNSETLIPLIQKHVRPGTRIYSDSWAAYMHLNTLCYQHFTVVHKTTFKQRYRNVDTGEVLDCHTNRIEGAWKICKDHFRRINGTNRKLFEQHIAEMYGGTISTETMCMKHFSTYSEIYTHYMFLPAIRIPYQFFPRGPHQAKRMRGTTI